MDAAEREAILADWRAEATVPVPPDTSQVGCVVAALAVVAAVAFPALVRRLGVALPAGTGGLVLGCLMAVFALGVFRALTGKAKGFDAVAGRAAEALGRLTSHPEDRGPGARRAAVALLQCAYCSNGPSMETTFDIAAARGRLGAALPFVLEVERVLVSDAHVHPVFTAD